MDQRGQQGGGGSPWLVLPPHQQLDWSLAAARNAVLAFLQDSWHASMGARGGGRWCWPHLGILGASAPSSLRRAHRTVGWRGICFGSCAYMCCTGVITQRTGPAAKAPVLRFQLDPRHQPHRSFCVYPALPHFALWLFHFLCLFLFIF